MEILKTSALGRQYQMGTVTVDALQGVDFTVQPGEFVAIMGPSGSGKSTLLHLLGGLDVPSEGEILLADSSLTHLSDDQLTIMRRREVGFIFQFFNLLPTLTTSENIALPLMLDGKDLRDYSQHIDHLLELVNLSDRRDHLPEQLSGGEQQRVAIARAFVNQPRIVLADEPTGNLDSRSGTVVLDLLQHACRELKTTVVMVTHDPHAASYADRVVFLKDGRLVRELPATGSSHDPQLILQVIGELEL